MFTGKKVSSHNLKFRLIEVSHGGGKVSSTLAQDFHSTPSIDEHKEGGKHNLTFFFFPLFDVNIGTNSK